MWRASGAKWSKKKQKMDEQIIPKQLKEFKRNLEEFLFNLIQLNLELISINPHDIVDFDEKMRPVQVKVKGIKQLFDKIEEIALFLKEHEQTIQ